MMRKRDANLPMITATAACDLRWYRGLPNTLLRDRRNSVMTFVAENANRMPPKIGETP